MDPLCDSERFDDTLNLRYNYEGTYIVLGHVEVTRQHGTPRVTIMFSRPGVGHIWLHCTVDEVSRIIPWFAGAIFTVVVLGADVSSPAPIEMIGDKDGRNVWTRCVSALLWVDGKDEGALDRFKVFNRLSLQARAKLPRYPRDDMA